MIVPSVVLRTADGRVLNALGGIHIKTLGRFIMANEIEYELPFAWMEVEERLVKIKLDLRTKP